MKKIRVEDLNLLKSKDLHNLLTAVIERIPIVIDGPRNVPTGKSRLCETLRTLGVDACELWELEEAEKGASSDHTNHTCFYIWLGEKL